MVTREIYKIGDDGSRTYAGFGKFGRDGKYLGSGGGYGSRQNNKGGSEGKGNVYMGKKPFNGGLPNQGVNRVNGGSMMQNSINSAGARADARRRNAFRAIR